MTKAERAKAETAIVAKQLRAMGWEVELSADGSSVKKMLLAPARPGVEQRLAGRAVASQEGK